MLLIPPAERAILCDESNNERSPGFHYPRGLPKCRGEIIQKANRGDHQGKIEARLREWQCFRYPLHHLKPPLTSQLAQLA